jgi:Uma2 family endonuclease
MTEHAPILAGSPLDTTPVPLKLRIEDYETLDQAGAFADYAKTELIEGEIYFVNAQHRPHALLKMELYDRLRDWLRNSQSPLRPLVEAAVAMPPYSAPEPDIALASEPMGQGMIPLASLSLVVEVADTSLDQDLGRKVGMYARHQVTEYWVADVKARVIHQMWAPANETYREHQTIAFGSPLKSATISGLEIDTDFPG